MGRKRPSQKARGTGEVEVEVEEAGDCSEPLWTGYSRLLATFHAAASLSSMEDLWQNNLFVHTSKDYQYQYKTFIYSIWY